MDLTEKYKDYERLYRHYSFLYKDKRVVISRANAELKTESLFECSLTKRQDEPIETINLLDQLKNPQADWNMIDRQLSEMIRFDKRVKQLEKLYKKKLLYLYKERVRFDLIKENRWDSELIGKINSNSFLLGRKLINEVRQITDPSMKVWREYETRSRNQCSFMTVISFNDNLRFEIITREFLSYKKTMRSLLNKNFKKDPMIKRKKYIQLRNNSISIVY